MKYNSYLNFYLNFYPNFYLNFYVNFYVCISVAGRQHVALEFGRSPGTWLLGQGPFTLVILLLGTTAVHTKYETVTRTLPFTLLY
jgi:hypothetical protein